MAFRFACVLCSLSITAACKVAIPQAELDRCNLGVADGNDAFLPRQGPACRMVAERLTADERPIDAAGYARTDDAGRAELILLNTCAVREKAEERVYARASMLAEHKSRPGVVLGITGCMAEHLKEVDAIAHAAAAPTFDNR